MDEREGVLLSSRRPSGTRVLDLFAGALAATIALTVILLPYVAQESDSRLSRRQPGSDDAAVMSSYGYSTRYFVFNALGEAFPGADFFVLDDAWPGRNLQLHLAAYAAAGQVCTLGPVGTLHADRLVGTAPGIDPYWELEHRGLSYSIVAGAAPVAFLVIGNSDGVRVIDTALVQVEVEQERCDHVG